MALRKALTDAGFSSAAGFRSSGGRLVRGGHLPLIHAWRTTPAARRWGHFRATLQLCRRRRLPGCASLRQPQRETTQSGMTLRRARPSRPFCPLARMRSAPSDSWSQTFLRDFVTVHEQEGDRVSQLALHSPRPVLHRRLRASRPSPASTSFRGLPGTRPCTRRKTSPARPWSWRRRGRPARARGSTGSRLSARR